MYAAPGWGCAAKTQFNVLEIFQNKVSRIIAKLPRVSPIEITGQNWYVNCQIRVRRLDCKLLTLVGLPHPVHDACFGLYRHHHVPLY
jgi:hypothetical protein